MKPAPPNTCVATRVASTAVSVRVQLGHRRGLLERLALVLQPGRRVGEVAAVLDGDREVGQLEREALEPADRPAERLPLLGVVDRQCRGTPARNRRRAREMAMRPSSRMARKLRSPLPGSPSMLVGGHPAVVEREAVGVAGVPAELAVRGLDDQPGRAGRAR